MAMLNGKYGGGDEEEGPEGKSHGPGIDLSGMGKKRAAKDVLSALEAGDAGALSAALEAHYEACQGGHGKDEE